jgi:hypothetical protein
MQPVSPIKIVSLFGRGVRSNRTFSHGSPMR